MRILFLITILNIISTQLLFGQKDEVHELPQVTYSLGRAEDFDGKVIKGNFAYSPQINYLYWKKSDGTIISFQAKEIFTFDLRGNKYYSLPYDMNEDGHEESVFFKVLLERANLAFLKYRGRNLKQTVESSGTSLASMHIKTEIKEVERYFIVYKDEGVKPIAEKKDYEFFSTRDIDEELLEHIFKNKYYQVMNYVLEHDINIETIEGYIEMLKYYSSI